MGEIENEERGPGNGGVCTLGRKRQAELCKFKDSKDYRVITLSQKNQKRKENKKGQSLVHS